MKIMHMGTQTLSTPNLMLRKYTEKDIEPIYKNLFSDEKTAQYMSWKGVDKHQVEEQVQKEIASYEDKSFYRWVITLKNGTPIGEIGVNGYDETKERVQIGYSLGSKWWNNGYMTEALKRVISYFLDTIGIKIVEAWHKKDNVVSGRVMKKCGMHYVDTTYREEVTRYGKNKTIILDRYMISK